MKKIIFCSSLLIILPVTAGCQKMQLDEGSRNNPSTEMTQTTERPTSSTQASTQSVLQSETTVSETSTPNDSYALPEGVSISASEAIRAFKKAYPDRAITKLELDRDRGHYFYQIEGVDDQKEYEAAIDARTGNLQKTGMEMLDYDEQNGVKKQADGIDTENLLSIEQAGKTAVQKAGFGNAVEWDLDKDLGITYWEVKVREGQREFQVKMDAKSGEVLSSEYDG